MQITEEIRTIIQEGKLNTYYFGSSFIEVYWEHPSLNKGSYYRFRFTNLNNTFLDVTVESPRYLYIKHKPKIYKPLAEGLVKSL